MKSEMCDRPLVVDWQTEEAFDSNLLDPGTAESEE